MNSRLNAIPTIETAMRLLESYGYDTTTLWTEHHSWLAQFDERKPTDHDHKWATRADAPSPIEQHFIRELKFPIYADGAIPGSPPIGWRTEKEYGPERLSASNAFPDRQFTLSPGQRDVLRTAHGLTPTQVVVLRNVVTFPGTNVLYQITIVSAEHIDPRRRNHVLVSAVINAAEFFEKASERDKEREAARAEADEKADKKRVAKGESPRSVKRLALTYFE